MIKFGLVAAFTGFWIGSIACPAPDISTAVLYGAAGTVIGSLAGAAANFVLRSRRKAPNYLGSPS